MTLQTHTFKPHDFARINPAKTQPIAAEWAKNPRYIASLMRHPGWTVYDEGGEVVAMFGYHINWPGVATAWCLLGDVIRKKHILRVSKEINRTLVEGMKEHGVWRVDTTVEQDFQAGISWAILLGFEIEGPLRKYGPDGKDHWMMARIV